MNMERHFFTTKYNCPNKCQYCFETFNDYPFSEISYVEIENLDNCIIYPACNTELLCIDKLNAFFEDYISKSKHFNIFSFSTKNKIKESDSSSIAKINNRLKEKNIGEIKISISLSNKHKINEIEQNSAIYEERLSLAKKLCQNGIKTTVIIKPILPFISVDEYKEIINDFVSIGVCHFVTGNLYFQENTPFFEKYIKGKGYNVTSKNIHWIKNTPTWQYIDSNNTIQELSEYINSLNGFHYNSDKELLEDIYK